MPCSHESLTRDWIVENFDRDVASAWEPALPLLRDEDRVLTPAAMRHSLATEGSLAATLVRRIIQDGWRFTTLIRSVDESAGGDIAYRIEAPDGLFTFGVRSVVRPDDGDRAGRLRESIFDFYGCIFAGEVSPEVVAAEHDEQVAASWKGRTAANALGWSFANRGSRTFEATIAALAGGRPAPLEEVLDNGGYLVRNAGFYGNGRHGSVPWLELASGGALEHPYHLDLLTLFMLKLASFDFVEEAARQRHAGATRLSSEFRRRVGVGNSSGIGTVATLVRWPTTLAALTLGRELAVARGRALLSASPTAETIDRLATLMARYADEIDSVRETADPAVAPTIERISRALRSGELDQIDDMLAPGGCPKLAAVLVSALADLDPDAGWDAMPIVARLIRTTVEPDPHATVREVLAAVEARYAWVRELTLAEDLDRSHFWYRSSENGENRRGERAVDPGVERETFVDVATAIRETHERLRSCDPQMSVGELLLAAPQLTSVVGRALLAGRLPYTEIRANLVSRNFAPADVIHYFLTGLGIRRARAASNLWVGGVFMADLPDRTPVEPRPAPSGIEGTHVVALRSPTVDSDTVRVGYPELRRLVPDVLRSIGVPATITAETAELTTWTEAATGSGIGALLDVHSRACRLRGVEPSRDELALEGRSLLLLGVRIAEYAAVRSLTTKRLRLTDARHLGALPYLSVLLARRGLTSTVTMGDGRAKGRRVIWAAPTPSGGRVEAEAAFLDLVRREPTVQGDVTISLGDASLAYDADDVVDLSAVVGRCKVEGLRVERDRHRALLAASASLRVPTSERSRSQAG